MTNWIAKSSGLIEEGLHILISLGHDKSFLPESGWSGKLFWDSLHGLCVELHKFVLSCPDNMPSLVEESAIFSRGWLSFERENDASWSSAVASFTDMWSPFEIASVWTDCSGNTPNAALFERTPLSTLGLDSAASFDFTIWKELPWFFLGISFGEYTAKVGLSLFRLTSTSAWTCVDPSEGKIKKLVLHRPSEIFFFKFPSSRFSVLDFKSSLSSILVTRFPCALEGIVSSFVVMSEWPLI